MMPSKDISVDAVAAKDILSHVNVEEAERRANGEGLELSLQRRQIGDLSGAFDRFSSLVVLDLSRNLISSLIGLEQLRSLRSLLLYFNKVQTGDEILRLRDCPLEKLDMRLNPVAQTTLYRMFVCQNLRGIHTLDNRVVSDHEKKKAGNLPRINAADIGLLDEMSLSSESEHDTDDEFQNGTSSQSKQPDTKTQVATMGEDGQTIIRKYDAPETSSLKLLDQRGMDVEGLRNMLVDATEGTSDLDALLTQLGASRSTAASVNMSQASEHWARDENRQGFNESSPSFLDLIVSGNGPSESSVVKGNIDPSVAVRNPGASQYSDQVNSSSTLNSKFDANTEDQKVETSSINGSRQETLNSTEVRNFGNVASMVEKSRSQNPMNAQERETQHSLITSGERREYVSEGSSRGQVPKETGFKSTPSQVLEERFGNADSATKQQSYSHGGSNLYGGSLNDLVTQTLEQVTSSSREANQFKEQVQGGSGGTAQGLSSLGMEKRAAAQVQGLGHSIPDKATAAPLYRNRNTNEMDEENATSNVHAEIRHELLSIRQSLKVLEEENKALKAENQRLRERKMETKQTSTENVLTPQVVQMLREAHQALIAANQGLLTQVESVEANRQRENAEWQQRFLELERHYRG